MQRATSIDVDGRVTPLDPRGNSEAGATDTARRCDRHSARAPLRHHKQQSSSRRPHNQSSSGRNRRRLGAIACEEPSGVGGRRCSYSVLLGSELSVLRATKRDPHSINSWALMAVPWFALNSGLSPWSSRDVLLAKFAHQVQAERLQALDSKQEPPLGWAGATSRTRPVCRWAGADRSVWAGWRAAVRFRSACSVRSV